MNAGRLVPRLSYIPLGGSRCSVKRQLLNLLTSVRHRLWHGALQFHLWGLYYGVLLIGEKFLYGKFLEKTKVLSRVYFFIVTVVGFEIFSAGSLSDIGSRICELVGVGTDGITSTESSYYALSYAVVILLAVVLSLPLVKWLKEKISGIKGGERTVRYAGYVICLLLLAVSTAYLVDGSYNPFLYFQVLRNAE